VVEEDEILFDNMTEDMQVEEVELSSAVIAIISVPIFIIGVVVGLTICICISKV
jgi:flagellar biosynthesis protein FliQ